MTTADADVLVVGLGPVGLFAAIALGRSGHRVIGIDRWSTPYQLPRAVTFDHEIARILSTVGIDSDNDPAIDYYDAIYRWLGTDHQTLMEIDWSSTASDGWRNRYWFSQPALEGRLRTIAASLPEVTLLYGYEATEFEQDDDGVRITYRETVVEGKAAVVKEGGAVATASARFLVASDGANSFVRRALGLEMTDLNFYYDWLVVDVQPHDLKLYEPPHYQLCTPTPRPTTVVPGGPGAAPGLPPRRRWEFMALPGETREELEDPQTVWRLLEPFDVTPGNTTLERAVLWRFQARYLDRFRVGRVCLAGDAAHLMPPFAGEGMCAGLRDVSNLAWRLDLVLSGKADPDSLDSYSTERRDHVKWYIDFSVDIGRVICVADAHAAAERDARLEAEHLARAGQGPISPHDAVLGSGAWAAADPLAGRPSIHGRVVHRGRTGRFDDVVGRGWMLLSAPGRPVDLASDLDAALALLGCERHVVGPVGSGADVIDIEGIYGTWLADNGLRHVLVRPDFYIAATAPDDCTLRSTLASLLPALGLMPVSAGVA